MGVALSDLKNDRFRSCPVDRSLHATLGQNTADLLHGLLRSNVANADNENDPVDILKRVIQHQTLHLGVVDSAPVRTGQESPTNLELGRTVPVVSGRADNLSCLSIHGYQGTARLQTLIKVLPEALLFVPIARRMNFPNEWVRRDCI